MTVEHLIASPIPKGRMANNRRCSSSFSRTTIAVISAVVVVLASLQVVAVPPSSAQAEVSTANVSCHFSFSDTDPYDSGGQDATSWWNGGSSCNQDWTWPDMKAHFNAYDEFLWFRADSDIKNVYVDFRVYRHSVINLPGGGRSWVVDYDKLRENADAYGYTNIQLGTPDGEGNIPEGRRVQFRICGDPDGGRTKCGAWAYGRS